MEYSKILEHLQQSSAYDLYRLHNTLERMLDDPNRIFRIKQAIHPGDNIEYFDSAENKVMKARVISFQRSRLVVENLDNHKKLNIPYLAVNTNALTDDCHNHNTAKIERSQLRLGTVVAFNDGEGIQQHGEIIELGTHSATLESNAGVWRVNYSQLLLLVDEKRQELKQR